MRELMVVEDARSHSCCQLERPRTGPLDPHVIERGGCQIDRRGRSLADEALHQEAVEKTLRWNQTVVPCDHESDSES